MRVAFIIFLCVLRGFAASTAVDVYLDMESGSDGSVVNANLLNSATHGAGGTWTTSPTSLSAMRVTSDFEPLLGGPVLVGADSYVERTTTRGYAFRNSTDREFARYIFDETHPKVSMGCFVRIGNFTGSTFGSYDIIAMEGDGQFAVLNFQDFPGDDFVFQIHTRAGTRDAFLVRPNTTYWVTLLWDQPNRRASLKVFDVATWQLVGSSSLGLQDPAVPQDPAKECETVCFGRYDDHDVTSPAYHYYDDLMIDYSAANFPILPARIGPAVEPISLAVEGEGSIFGASSNQFLQVDRAYTLTAKPASGHLFVGWTGSTSSMNSSLKFVMTSNLAYTAHFIPNPFPVLKGSYTGLFYDPSNTVQHSSGYMQLTVGTYGAYSAKVLLNGKSHSASGTLAPDGTGVCVFRRTGTTAMEVLLRLDMTNGTDRLDGSIVDPATNEPSWTAALALNRLTFGKLNPAPGSGRYTFCILPDSGSSNGPQGAGHGTLTVSPSGALAFAGALADGTKVSQRTSLSKSGEWPLYLSLYKGRGSLLCPAVVDTNQPDSDITGPLHWFKQSGASANVYPNGFTNSTEALGSHYLAPSLMSPLLNLTEGVIEFSPDNISTLFSNLVELTPQNAFVNRSLNKLSLSVSKSTGRFSGSVVPPAGGKALPFSGVVLQRQNRGAGFFLDSNQSGSVVLEP